MKIDGNIISVKTTGDQLEVELQGTERGADACWRPMAVVTVRFADTEASRRAFYVGRGVTIDITPKKARR